MCSDAVVSACFVSAGLGEVGSVKGDVEAAKVLELWFGYRVEEIYTFPTSRGVY